MKKIVLDTETTGLDADGGDRIIEIGMVEVDADMLVRTGKTFHRYVNPERAVSDDAYKIHGLSTSFLAERERFAEIADEVFEFMGEADIVIHNAGFDMAFLNRELAILGRPNFPADRVFDTLDFARREHPKLSRFSLDALCDHFRIDRSHRTVHGALRDAELLAEVYFRLLGKGSAVRSLLDEVEETGEKGLGDQSPIVEARPEPLPPRITPEEERAHSEFIRTSVRNALWLQQ